MGLVVSEKKELLEFFLNKSLGAICGHGGHLDLRTICTHLQSAFNRRFKMKSEDIWPRGFREEVVQRSKRTEELTNG